MLNLDTHILLYALAGELSAKENKLLRSEQWSISAIVLWEITKLSELRRIEIDLENTTVSRILSLIPTWPLTLDICKKTRDLDVRSDPADEIIAATSIVHGIPLVTRDKNLRKSKMIPMID